MDEEVEATTQEAEDEKVADEAEDEKVVDEAEHDTTVAPIQYDISSFGADYDVDGFVKRLKRNGILIPPFQRNYVWSQQEASRFIESLLLGLPVPGVFLVRERVTNKLNVIDGQQRLKTLQFFYEGFFNPHQNDEKKQVFKLVKVQKKFEGRTYATLDENDRVKLDDTVIHATIVKQDSPKDDDTSIYHVFQRLNSQGRLLTPQEIRTAIYHGPFIDMLKSLNDFAPWREIYGKKSNRLKDQELILRFLALYFAVSTYERPMVEFLNKFVEKHQFAEEEFLIECQNLFQSTIHLIWRIIGIKAFRPSNAINTAVFDSVMVGLSHRIEQAPINDYTAVKDVYNKLLDDPEFQRLVSRATSDESNVRSRLNNSIEQFGSV